MKDKYKLPKDGDERKQQYLSSLTKEEYGIYRQGVSQGQMSGMLITILIGFALICLKLLFRGAI